MSVPPPPGIGSHSPVTATVPAAPTTTAPATAAPVPASSTAVPNVPVSATVAPTPTPVAFAPTPVPVTRSCASCMFYIAPDDTEGQMKIAKRPTVGGAMCGKLRTVLTTMTTEGEPNRTERELSKIGSNCSEYALADPQEPRAVIEIKPEHSGIFFGAARDHNMTTDGAVSCRRCIFHVADSDMAKTGLIANACSLRSMLIPNGNAAAVASECDLGVMDDAPNASTFSAGLMTISMDSHLEESTGDDDDADDDASTNKAGISAKRGPGRPRKLPNDASALEAASDEDMRMGIKGWTKIVDKSNKDRFVMLPVFDPNFFEASERAKIPQAGDDEHPEMYQDHQNVLYKAGIVWRKLNETPALNGVSGVGKTEFFRYAAFIMQLPFERISISNSTELDDLAGKIDLVKSVGADGNAVNHTEFVYGRIPKAWAKPCVIVIDEPNTGPNDVWQFLRPLTDSSKQLVMDVNKGERISRNPFCFMGMAMNPSWDVRNVGTHEISDADGSRLMHISMPAPDRKLEMKILKDNCKVYGYAITDEMLETIMNISVDIRELAKNETIDMHWGTRQQIKVAKASQHFDLRDCYRMAAADLLDPDQSEALLQCVNSYTPGSTPRRAARRATRR